MKTDGRVEDSLSFEDWKQDKVKESTVSSMDQDMQDKKEQSSSESRQKDAAATKLQKVYKSYRTRRNLADCAVVAEELWWKALEFAFLKHNSVSFFHDGEHETAVSRWARAGMRAAKVGRGLSRDNKAQKLALRHWLEAIDPRHRYGHNLHLYYDVWFESESVQPFFYWLDIGHGKDVNLEKCPRSKLQRQCVKYLGLKERQAYEIIIEDEKLIYKQSRELLDTAEGSKWIFVLSTSRALYVGQKKKGLFHHSSFLAGGATIASGRLVAKEGVLKAVWPYSGHYLPTEENFKELISFLKENSVDLSNVKRSSIDKDDYSTSKEPNSEQEVEDYKSTALAHQPTELNEHDLSETEAEEVPLESSKTEISEVNDLKTTVYLQNCVPCGWSTGAGARIRCVRDYPTDLQCKALEHVNLSPGAITSPAGNKIPIPVPRPSPQIRLSPAPSNLRLPTLPKPRSEALAAQ